MVRLDSDRFIVIYMHQVRMESQIHMKLTRVNSAYRVIVNTSAKQQSGVRLKLCKQIFKYTLE